jgi:hypothetical protein
MPRYAGESHAIQRGWEIAPGFVQELGIRLERAHRVHDRASLGCLVLHVA